MIVKAVQAGHGSDESWVNLRTEARALRLAESSGVTPALLLLDGEQRLLVQEDIEGSHSLADVLLGTDGAAAREALVRYGAALGRLHAATPLDSAPGDGLPLSRPRAALERLRPVLTDLGLVLDDAVEGDVAAVQVAISDPGPWAALVHGDPCPDNTVIRADGTAALFDFEHAGHGHALLDASYIHLPFPTCWCANRVPDDVAADADAAYRDSLGELGADSSYEAALAAAVASGALCALEWHLAPALERDGTWGIATVRQRQATRLRSLATAAERAGQFEALADFALRLAATLTDRWARLEPLPVYQAFR
jgi:Ser/Thr protein kinase RdoA (MazF antagonist)